MNIEARERGLGLDGATLALLDSLNAVVRASSLTVQSPTSFTISTASSFYGISVTDSSVWLSRMYFGLVDVWKRPDLGLHPMRFSEDMGLPVDIEHTLSPEVYGKMAKTITDVVAHPSAFSLTANLLQMQIDVMYRRPDERTGVYCRWNGLGPEDDIEPPKNVYHKQLADFLWQNKDLHDESIVDDDLDDAADALYMAQCAGETMILGDLKKRLGIAVDLHIADLSRDIPDDVRTLAVDDSPMDMIPRAYMA